MGRQNRVTFLLMIALLYFAGEHIEAEEDVKDPEVQKLTAKLAEAEAKLAELTKAGQQEKARSATLENDNKVLAHEKKTLEHSKQELQEKLKTLETKASDLESKAKALETKTAELETKTKALETKTKAVETKNAELETKTKALETKKAELETLYKEATAKLEAANSEAGAWKKETTLAKSKASDKEKQLIEQVTALTAELQAKEAELAEAASKNLFVLSSVLPAGVVDSLDQATASVQPYIRETFEKVQQYAAEVQKKAVALWKQYKPVVDSYTAEYVAFAKLHGGKALHKAKEITDEVLKNEAVKSVVSQASTVLSELEKLAASYLKQVPALEPFAQPPTITYILYSLFVLPVVLLSLPLLARKRKLPEQTKAAAKKEGGNDTAPVAAPTKPKPKGSQKKGGKKISVGKDAVLVP